jgi:DNA-binding transcriptional MerR regulator
MVKGYTPAAAVAESGFSLDTLRYYERAGLLPAIARDSAGRRRYSEQDLLWAGLLRCLRETGMSIADVKRFVDLCNDGPGTQRERLALLEDHDRQIDDRVQQLTRDRARLQAKIESYRRGSASAPAPNGYGPSS